MPAFSSHILTQGGQALIAQAHLGRKLTFTKISVGSGNVATPINATALAAHQMDVGITSIQRDATNANWVRVRGMFTNVSLTTGFQFREMGLFARIDSEPEVLYSYVADAGTGDLIPAYDGANPVIIYPTMIVIIESTIPIHADITIGADYEAENIGLPSVGPGVYSHRDGNVFKFRRLREGALIEITQDDGTITIGQKILEVDLDLYVPLTHPDAPGPEVSFPTIQAAWDSLSQITIPPNRTATINVAAGRYDLNTPLKLRHPQADRISIIGAAPVRAPITLLSAFAGAVNNWQCTITTTDAPLFQVGDTIGFWGGVSVGMDGAFRITATTATTITIIVPSSRAMNVWNPGSAGAAASILIRYPTQIIQSARLPDHTIEFFAPGIRVFKNFGINDWRTTGTLYHTIAIYQGSANVNLELVAISRSDLTNILVNGSGNSLYCKGILLGNPQQYCLRVANGAYLETRRADAPFNEIGLAAHSSYGWGIDAYASTMWLNRVRSEGHTENGITSAAGSNASILDSSSMAYSQRGLVATGVSFLQMVSGANSSANGNGLDLYAENAGFILMNGNTYGTTNPAINTSGNGNGYIRP